MRPADAPAQRTFVLRLFGVAARPRAREGLVTLGRGRRNRAGFPVAPGDEVICCLAVESGTAVAFHLKNQSSGHFVNFRCKAPGPGSPVDGTSAEWIVERPAHLKACVVEVRHWADFESSKLLPSEVRLIEEALTRLEASWPRRRGPWAL